jgi:AraC-like DNA-binding protein
VANQIYLTESNFCKFFKKATGKTYSDYLNEIRINEATRLLLQTDKTISQISFECGFETQIGGHIRRHCRYMNYHR